MLNVHQEQSALEAIVSLLSLAVHWHLASHTKLAPMAFASPIVVPTMVTALENCANWVLVFHCPSFLAIPTRALEYSAPASVPLDVMFVPVVKREQFVLALLVAQLMLTVKLEKFVLEEFALLLRSVLQMLTVCTPELAA